MVEPRRIELLTSCVQSRRSPSWAKAPFQMVGKTGFEPATPWSQTRCTTKLCYFPLDGAPDRNWTRNPLFRRQVLYPVELLAQFMNGALGRNRTGTEFEVRRILSPVRLPVSPPGHTYGGSNRTWTDDRRVAVFCLTNLAMEPSQSRLLV